MFDLLEINFVHKEYLYGLILVFFIIFYYYFISKKNSIKINFFGDLEKKYQKFNYFFLIKLFLIIFIYSIFIIILADPQKINFNEKIKKNGIDIVFVLDISESMNANDLTPTRIKKAKELIKKFIKKQKTNRTGLVIFAGKPISSIPLTFDYDILLSSLEDISTDIINQNIDGLDGTAVGDALLIGEKMFKDKNREKVIILLTDGDSNRGVNPVLVAGEILKKNNIKVYTIGIGSKLGGKITYKIGKTIKEQKIPPLNENTLKKISQISSGKFFRATDNRSFEEIFNNLESLEKNEITVKSIKINSGDYKRFFIILLFSLSFLFVLELRKN